MKKVSFVLSLSLLFVTLGTKPMQGLTMSADFENVLKAAQKLNLSPDRIERLMKVYGSLGAVILAKRYNIPANQGVDVLKAAARGNKSSLKQAIAKTNQSVLGANWRQALTDFRTLSNTAYAKKYSKDMQRGVGIVLNIYNAASDLYFKRMDAGFYLNSALTVSKAKQFEAMSKLNQLLGIR